MFKFLRHIFYVKPKQVVNTISKLRLMKKKELELLGRKYGIELDRRYKKAIRDFTMYLYRIYKKETLVKELWEKMSNVWISV